MHSRIKILCLLTAVLPSLLFHTVFVFFPLCYVRGSICFTSHLGKGGMPSSFSTEYLINLFLNRMGNLISADYSGSICLGQVYWFWATSKCKPIAGKIRVEYLCVMYKEVQKKFTSYFYLQG